MALKYILQNKSWGLALSEYLLQRGRFYNTRVETWVLWRGCSGGSRRGRRLCAGKGNGITRVRCLGRPGEALGLAAPHSEGTPPGFARPKPGRSLSSLRRSVGIELGSVAIGRAGGTGGRSRAEVADRSWGRAGGAGARPLLARDPRASRGSVPEGHGEPGVAAGPAHSLPSSGGSPGAEITVGAAAGLAREGAGPRAGKGAAAASGGWARPPRAQAWAPRPSLLCPAVAGPQAHAQSPGSWAARGLALPGWARTRLGWARRAEEEGGRERAGGRKGEERSEPSQSGGGAGARTPGETEQRLPAGPAPRRRCRRVSRDPSLGAAGAARRGGAGSGRGKVGRSGGRSAAAPPRGPPLRREQGATRAEGPGRGLWAAGRGAAAAGSGACARRAHGGGPGGGRAGAPRGSGRAPSAARGQAGRAPRRGGARRPEPGEASPSGNR